MDATRLRELVTGAIEAQRALDAACASEDAAREARTRARERHLAECGNLKAALADGFVIFGESVLRVGNNNDGIRLYSYPLVSVPVLAPPPAPLPESPAAPKPASLSGGKVPDAVKKLAPVSGK